MASRGRGRRGRPRGTGHASVFDQQAFVEVVGIAVTSIAQAGITGSPGEVLVTSRGLGRIILQHFTGGGGGGGGRSDGGRPLVYVDREGVRGHGDYL